MESDKTIFEFETYRKYLSYKIKSMKDHWGYQAKLSQAAQCQPAYFSQVLKGNSNLSFEQGMGLARYWNLNHDETDYFLLLIQWDRAGQDDLKNFLNQKMTIIKKNHEVIKNKFSHNLIDNSEVEKTYYSTWYWSAIHVIVSIPEYQTEDKIAKRLNLDASEVGKILNHLQQFGLVAKRNQKWILVKGNLHLSKESPMNFVNHLNWRIKAVQNSSLNQDGVHFTSVYSISKEDYQHFKNLILDLIEKTRKLISPSKEEELIAFMCDIFKV